MRIAIINAAELEMSPYLRSYTELFEKLGVDYDLIEWRRDLPVNNKRNNIISFNYPSSIQKKAYGKLIDYWRFGHFAKSVINKKRYDKLIVVEYQTALFMRRFLTNKFSGRYLLDIRDYSEIFKFIKGFVKKVDKNAFARIISSVGYKEWTTRVDREVVCHNTTIERLDEAVDILESPFMGPIVVLTNGALRTYDMDIRVVDAFEGSDVHFKFSGKGKDSEKYASLAKNNIKVEYTGYYKREDEVLLAKQASFINIFLENCERYNTAMSNRFYLSLVAGVPMIVNSQNIQSQYVTRYHLGVIADSPEDLPFKIKQYIERFDIEEYNEGRRQMIAIIKKDINAIYDLLKEFIEQ